MPSDARTEYFHLFVKNIEKIIVNKETFTLYLYYQNLKT